MTENEFFEKYYKRNIEIYIDLTAEYRNENLSVDDRLKCLKSFKDAATPERINEIADDLNVHERYSPLLMEFLRLANKFAEVAPADDPDMATRLDMAILKRDTEYFKFLGDHMMHEGTALKNPAYQTKIASMKNTGIPLVRVK